MLQTALIFLTGLLLAFAGRRLFWVFIAVAGFLAGLNAALAFFGDPVTLPIILLALGCAVVACAVSLLIPHVAAALAGFLALGWLAVHGAELLAGPLQQWQMPVYIAGGIIGALLALAAFEWVLVILSSLLGASLIVSVLPVAPDMQIPTLVVVAVIGSCCQLWLGRTSHEDSSELPGHHRSV